MKSLSSTYQSSSSSSRRRLRTSQFKSQHSDQISIKCLQARIQQTYLQESLNQHMIAKVFSSLDVFDRRHLFIFLSSYCFSKSRTLLFCFSSSFSDFNETQTESKNSLFTSLQDFAKHSSSHIDHVLFCSVFHWIFQILTRHRQHTKNHLFYLFIDRACCHCSDYHSIDRRRHRCNNQASLNSKATQIYNSLQIFFLSFFLSHRRSRDDFR